VRKIYSPCDFDAILDATVFMFYTVYCCTLAPKFWGKMLSLSSGWRYSENLV